MTREEQIIAKAGDLSDFATNHGAPASYTNGYYEGFQEGAKWADKNPKERMVDIDDVISILKAVDYTEYISSITNGVGVISFNADNFIEDVRKVIGGE